MRFAAPAITNFPTKVFRRVEFALGIFFIGGFYKELHEIICTAYLTMKCFSFFMHYVFDKSSFKSPWESSYLVFRPLPQFIDSRTGTRGARKASKNSSST